MTLYEAIRSKSEDEMTAFLVEIICRSCLLAKRSAGVKQEIAVNWVKKSKPVFQRGIAKMLTREAVDNWRGWNE